MKFRAFVVCLGLALIALIAFGIYQAFFKPEPFCPLSNPHCGSLPPGAPA